MTRNSISGYEEFQGELRLLYFASLTPGTGTLHVCEWSLCGHGK